MADSQHSLNAAQLAIYAFLAIPVLYIFIRHKLPGLLGWLYLFIFCTLRIIGAALVLKNGPQDTTAAIISSIGLSPLLLAGSGILHEARHYRIPKLNKKLEFIFMILFHLLVTTGLALVASGSSAFKTEALSAGASAENLLKVGIVILLFSWVILCIWTVASLLPVHRRRDVPTYSSGTKLMYAVLLALPLIGTRVLYSTIALLAPSKRLNAVSSALGLKLGLSFIPELIAVVVFVVVGLLTINVRRVQMDRGRGLETGVGMERMDRNKGDGA